MQSLCMSHCLDATRGLASAERIAMMPKGGVLVNLARGGICDDEAVLAALDSGHLHSYVIDFPTGALLKHPKVISFPHLGASTAEAEENCAVMVADSVREFLRRWDGKEFGQLSRSSSCHETVAAESRLPMRMCQIW